jgi:hypothetical protein
LVSILLFYKIPKEIRVESFDISILVFVVIVTSLVMMGGLIFTNHQEEDIERKQLLHEATGENTDATTGQAEPE